MPLSSNTIKTAKLYKRLIAFVFQLSISLFFLVGLAFILDLSWRDYLDDFPKFLSHLIVVALISMGLGAFLYPKYNGNLGHKIMGLKVISLETGEACTSSYGALRGFLKVICVPLIIPVLWAFLNNKKQTWWDYITNSIVVENID